MQSAQFQLHAQLEESHWWFVARRRILSSVIAAVLPADGQSTIIDVGCGTGANLAELADRYHCIGIDSSLQAVCLARPRFPQIEFIHGRAPRDLGDAMGRASMVLLTDVLEHVADDFSMLSELLAAAQPGTYFLLTVPADLSLWSEHDQTFGHYRRYDFERFRQIWQGLAVREQFVSYFNTRLYPVVKAIRSWNQWRGQAAGLVGTDFHLPSAASNYLLTECFAGERHRLAGLARGEDLQPYRQGVSLIALLQRQAVPVEPRTKPPTIAADFFDPVAYMANSTTV